LYNEIRSKEEKLKLQQKRRDIIEEADAAFEKGDLLKSFYLFEDAALLSEELGENDIMQTIRVVRNKVWNLWKKKKKN